MEGPLSRGPSAPRDLRPLFDPRSVAVVGASATAGKWGNWLSRNALKGKHRRRIFLVNRSGQDVLGEATFRSLDELPEPVDLVVIAIGAAGFESAVDSALAAGARAIVAVTAGMGEAGGAGQAAERRVAERVSAAGAILVGPNCLGIADPGTELQLSFGEFAGGPVGLVSQSGNLSLELALIAREAGLGFSRFISVGNQADLEVTELIDMFALHEPTRVIAAYVEDFRDGRAFVRAAARAAEAGKPVVLLTVGTSRAGAQAALSHTGALVSASTAVDAACRAGGILRVSTPREMVELAQGLVMTHHPRGRRVAVVGDGGGHVALAADLLIAHGMELPVLSAGLAGRIAATLPPAAATANPVDLAGGGEQDFFNYARTVAALAESGEVDAALLTGYFGGYGEDGEAMAVTETEVAHAMAAAVGASGRPLVVHSMYPRSPTLAPLRSARVPVYGDIRAAVRVLARMTEPRGPSVDAVPDVSPAPAGASAQTGYFEARTNLAAVGIPFVEAREAVDLGAARVAAEAIGYPVVLKALGRSHKSDEGGVCLRIATAAQLDTAWEDMRARLQPRTWSVERMAVADGGVELLVGVRRDHGFGPIVLVGAGGIYAELINDIAVALAPVSAPAAEALIRSLRVASLMTGLRGGQPLDVAAAARVVAALSIFAAERPDVSDVEINPLLVQQDGVTALDARLHAITSRSWPPSSNAPAYN